MTMTAEPATLIRHRDRSERTPQSQDPVKLLAMLEEPALVGFHDEIRAALADLAKTEEV